MAATAGTLVMISRRDGTIYTVDLYVPDATGTKIGFNPSGLAGTSSATSYRVPDDVNIVDISVAAAPTAVGAALTVNSAVRNGGAIRWTNQLATLATRLKQKVALNKGDFIEYTQY